MGVVPRLLQSLAADNRGLRPPPPHLARTMTHESPYLGWIVPYEWQESPEWLDGEPETVDYPPDCDAEGYLITQN